MIKPHLKHVILPFSSILIDNVTLWEAPHIIDIRAPYLHSSNRKPRKSQVTETEFDAEIAQLKKQEQQSWEDRKNMAEDTADEERQARLHELETARQQWRAKHDSNILLVQGGGGVRRIQCRNGMQGFTVFDLLCCSMNCILGTRAAATTRNSSSCAVWPWMEHPLSAADCLLIDRAMVNMAKKVV
jgi:hypothetical protein